MILLGVGRELPDAILEDHPTLVANSVVIVMFIGNKHPITRESSQLAPPIHHPTYLGQHVTIDLVKIAMYEDPCRFRHVMFKENRIENTNHVSEEWALHRAK